MSARISIQWNGRVVETHDGVMLAAALWDAGARSFRESVTGAARAPLCGMGVCFECRATVDGVPGVRTCTLPCRDGMTVETP